MAALPEQALGGSAFQNICRNRRSVVPLLTVPTHSNCLKGDSLLYVGRLQIKIFSYLLDGFTSIVPTFDYPSRGPQDCRRSKRHLRVNNYAKCNSLG